MATYYVDQSMPDDSGDGLSEENAWKTIDKVMTELNGNQPDDIVKFKKGEIWREMYTVAGYGTSGHMFSHTTYGTGADPIITATDDMTGVSGDWTDEGGNVWSRAAATEVKNVVFDTDHFGVEDATPAAQYEWDWVANELFVYATENPTSYYTTIEGGQRASCIQNFEKDYVEFNGFNCYGANGTHGVFVRSSTGVTVENCNIHQNNSKQINCSVNNVSDSHLTIHNNTVGNNSTDSHGIHVYQLGTGTWTYVTISDNTVSGIQDRAICVNGVNASTRMDGSNSTISGNTASGSGDGLYLLYVDDITVSGNTFHSNDDDTGVGELYGIGVLECDGCIFENNHLYSNSGEGMELSSEGGGSGCNGNIIRYNKIHDNNRDGGIKISNAMGTGQNEIYYNLIYNHATGGQAALYVRDPGHEIYNNVLYNNNRGLFIYNADGDNIKFKNNIIANTGASHVQCVIGLTGLDIDYNLYDDDTGTKFHWAGTDYNFANWKIQSSQDGNSPDIGDPKFVAPGSANFHLQSDSPCRNAGVNVGLTQDYDGVSVPQETNPAIGAFEFLLSEAGYSVEAKNAMLDALGGLAIFASLHDGDPGATGENELSGGDPSYARKAIAWNPATGGIMDSSNQPIFDIPAGKTIKHIGLWSAATGGTFYLSAPITNEAFASQGTHILTDGDLDLNA